MEKAVQTEAELFTNLELKRNLAEAVLADETRLRSNVRVTHGYLTKLESAVSDYEQAAKRIVRTLDDSPVRPYLDPLVALHISGKSSFLVGLSMT